MRGLEPGSAQVLNLDGRQLGRLEVAEATAVEPLDDDVGDGDRGGTDPEDETELD